MNKYNLLLNTDSYKASHWLQYPEGTTHVYSYIESRTKEPITWFGLRYIYDTYLKGKVFDQVDIDEAAEFYAAHGEPFNKEGWERMLAKHGGELPIKIEALPEGTRTRGGIPLATIVNTDPGFPWITSYIEPILMRVWYPTTVASVSKVCKNTVLRYLEETGTPESIHFKLHDFGARGVSSAESSAIGGMAHLVNFLGTDTVLGAVQAKRTYGLKGDVAGYSIPAAEHSTITSWGKDNEADAYRNMLKRFAKPGSLLAVVSDSYDIYNACSNIWGRELKDEVIASGATVVIRPDSGDPVTVVSKCLDILGARFGFTVNSKGYKVLNNVRLIQGDGITPAMIGSILFTMKVGGWSADNIAFGMGGGLLQQVNRDTYSFAMKCSAMKIDEKWRRVFKEPATDSGKRSKSGLVTTLLEASSNQLVAGDGLLETNYSEFLPAMFPIQDDTRNFDDIRQLAGW